MKKGESRFFLNWQMPKDTAMRLHMSTSDSEKTELLTEWLRTQNVFNYCFNEDNRQPRVLLEFYEMNCDFCKLNKFT